jgi:hypothetical protein
MSVIISQVYTVAICINVDYEQCCIYVGTFMICLHTKLHCNCVGVLVVIDINPKISERPPSYLKFYEIVSGTEIAYFFRFTTHRVRSLNCFSCWYPQHRFAIYDVVVLLKGMKLIPGFVKTCQQIQN